MWLSTGEVWEFYAQLQKACDDLKDEARFHSTDGQLQFTVTPAGGALLAGKYQERATAEEATTRLYFVAHGD
jgi:hypothetical protein